MTGRRRLAAAAAVVGWLVPLGSPLAGQAVATLGIGASIVEYDGFLSSGAAVLAPALRFDARNASLGGQASWTVFQSGNSVLQATAAAAWLSPPRGSWRIEIGGSAGGSKYADQPGTGHLLTGARVHLLGQTGGGWLGASTGVSSGVGGRVPLELSVAGWTVRNRFAIVGTLTTAWIGTDHHVDVAAAVRWTGAGVELEARTGARSWTGTLDGAGDVRGGVYGELSIVAPVANRIALTASAGRYPTDPVRKLLAAKYLAAGLRLGGGGRAATASAMIGAVARAERARRPDGDGPRLELGTAGSTRWIRVMAAGARSVELMGDFTDWEPVAMSEIRAGVWEARLAITPGVHRVNVRIDGGEWRAPAGARLERSEFGEVGVIAVP